MIKALCIIGLMIVLAFIFLAALPIILSAILNTDDNFETWYTLGLIIAMIIIITIISTVIVDFYFTPEKFGYQKIVSENCAESED